MKMMKFFGIIFIVVLSLSFFIGFSRAEEDVKREEEQGGKIFEKLQSKERVCSDLSDEDFERLGEYFMGQMLQESHREMNKMMVQMMGDDNEEKMHIVMGKRLSGCDADAEFPLRGAGFMPMMQMMMGGGSSPSGFNSFNKQNNPMMWNFGSNQMWGVGWFGLIFMIIFWALIIAAVIALIKWLSGLSRGSRVFSPLEILKERYARGEINKEEFESRKKDIL